jgi:hypothetical protein
MLLYSGKFRGFLTSLVRFWFTGIDIIDGAEDCNCSGICGKPVVTPEIGLSPRSEALYGNNSKVQRPLARERAVWTTLWAAWMVASTKFRYQQFRIETLPVRISPQDRYSHIPVHCSRFTSMILFSAAIQYCSQFAAPKRDAITLLSERFL